MRSSSEYACVESSGTIPSRTIRALPSVSLYFGSLGFLVSSMRKWQIQNAEGLLFRKYFSKCGIFYFGLFLKNMFFSHKRFEIFEGRRRHSRIVVVDGKLPLFTICFACDDDQRFLFDKGLEIVVNLVCRRLNRL